MTAAARFSPDKDKRLAIAKVKIAQKELRLDDAAYRAVLQRLTGKASASLCTAAELGRVLDEFKAKGWTPRTGPVKAPSKPALRAAQHPVARKARAMWISLHQLGVVRSADEAALEAFAARQLGVDRLQWADQAQGYRLIEALKAMAERAGWSQDLTAVPAERHVRVLRERLLVAQAAKVQAALPHLAELPAPVHAVREMTDQQLTACIGVFAGFLQTTTAPD